MAQKPSIPKGTRDFSASQVAKRNYIFDTVRSVFKLYGFSPIETPTMENLSTLMGKYGEEGDKLLFKVLNSGDYSAKLTDEELKNASKICEKGLRYDLTVPFARYVVQHRNDIVFPFKRYQIAPVWRADRPQKGRYREFIQCDVDVIGSRSLICEVELAQIVEMVFSRLNISVTLKINNRKILASIAKYIGFEDKLVDIAVAIDKFDKIGQEGVYNELIGRGISEQGVEMLKPIFSLSGTNLEKLASIESLIGKCEGIDEMRVIFGYVESIGCKLAIELDLSLARGLSYYTGAIFEVKANNFTMGSICGGGRYDDLTGIFGLANTSGVGISFGADRIYDIMVEGNLFPAQIDLGSKVLFVNFGGEDELASLRIITELRSKGVSAEIYPTSEKLKKQFDYAETHSIPYMVFIGQNERETGSVTLKNLTTGEQSTLSTDVFIDAIQEA